jgi:hypothetical protein
VLVPVETALRNAPVSTSSISRRSGSVALDEDLGGAASGRKASLDRAGHSAGDRLVGADGEFVEP